MQSPNTKPESLLRVRFLRLLLPLLVCTFFSPGCSQEADGTADECAFEVGRAGDDCSGGFGCGFGDFCSTRNGTCIDGKLSASALVVDDCAYDPPKDPTPEPRPGNLWLDCQAALAGGQTGEPCDPDGDGWACATHTPDGCCQDIAICETHRFPAPTLIMATSCAIDCSANSVDASRPTVTDCTEALTARPNDPCSGELSCIDYQAVLLDIRWCDEGTLRVNQQAIVPAIMMP